MAKLHLTTDIPASDAVSAAEESDWSRLLPDPVMLDATLYFAREVYAQRLQSHAMHFVAEAYKGKAIRSVKERLDDGATGLNESLIAAILILSVLDVRLGRTLTTAHLNLR